MKIKQFLEKECRVMLETFNLSHYSIDFYPVHMDADTVMEIDIERRYLSAEISYGKLARCLYKQHKYKQLRKILTHEICHLFTEDIKGDNEAITEHLSRLLFKLL